MSANSDPFKRVVICGVGLIGGSFALGLKAANMAEHVVGIGRNPQSLQEALALGVIDEIATDWATALADADLLLIATPVGQMDAVMAAAAPHLGPNTLITDAGSTKADVIEAIYRHLGEHTVRAVPSHPIAGAEKSGPSAAYATLYQDRKVIITPLPENAAAAIERVSEAWRACGAQLHSLSPQTHDRVFAAVSHLPHLLSFGLVHQLADRANAEQLFQYAASGFRDFTRIAGSHPEMWRDICLANRDPLLAELDAYLSELAWIRALLINADGKGLEKLFSEASSARNAWSQGQ